MGAELCKTALRVGIVCVWGGTIHCLIKILFQLSLYSGVSWAYCPRCGLLPPSWFSPIGKTLRLHPDQKFCSLQEFPYMGPCCYSDSVCCTSIRTGVVIRNNYVTGLVACICSSSSSKTWEQKIDLWLASLDNQWAPSSVRVTGSKIITFCGDLNENGYIGSYVWTLDCYLLQTFGKY